MTTPRSSHREEGDDRGEVQLDIITRRLLVEVAAIRQENSQLQKSVEELKRSQPKRKLFKQDVDTDCSDAVRKVYKELCQQAVGDEENHVQFDFTQRFPSQHNQSVSRSVVSEVRNLYGKKKWKKSMIKAAVASHWKSRRDDITRRRTNTFEKHRIQVKKLSRKKRKLENRQKAIDCVSLDPSDKAKAQEIFMSPQALDYISSEESDKEYNGRGSRPRKVLKISWQRSKLRNLKSVLDEYHVSHMTPKQRRTAAVIVHAGDKESDRSPPRDSPKWAVRQPTPNM